MNKYLKNILKHLIIFMSTLVVIYILGSLVELSFDITKWIVYTRIITSLIIFVSFIFTLLEIEDKSKWL